VTNVVSLEQYRSENSQRTIDEAAARPADLSTMSYYDLLTWAGFDFDRLLEAAAAKNYRPEWIAHQILDQGRDITNQQAMVLDQMISDAGPYLNRRQRWVLRQVKAKPTCGEVLAVLAAKAAEYRDYKHPERCVANDVAKLVERGLIQTRDGVISDAGESSERSNSAATPRTGVQTS
jgi:hypothetical protein